MGARCGDWASRRTPKSIIVLVEMEYQNYCNKFRARNYKTWVASRHFVELSQNQNLGHGTYAVTKAKVTFSGAGRKPNRPLALSAS